jgi:hypothetical protein
MSAGITNPCAYIDKGPRSQSQGVRPERRRWRLKLGAANCGSAADGSRPPSRVDRSAAEWQCEIQSNLLKL